MTTLNPLTEQPLGYPGGAGTDPALFFDVGQVLLSQYANSPVIRALLGALNYALDRQASFDAFYSVVWNVTTAKGFGLDIWGRIVGVGRALFVPDEAYLGFTEATDEHPFGEGIFYGNGSFTPNFLMSDSAYRKVILAKAAANITDCSIPAVNAILVALFTGYGNVYVRDNGDMTMTLVFGAAPSIIDYAIITQAGVLPKPVGVSFTVEHP